MDAVIESGAGNGEHFAVAQQALGFVTWIWNTSGDHVQWQGDLSALLGLPAGSFSGSFQQYLDALHPEDMLASRRTLKECLKGLRTEYRTEERVVWPDGSVHWLETYGRAFRGADGRVRSMSGVVRDITGRRQMEEARRQSEQQFATAFEACPDYMVISRLPDGRLVAVNPAFTRITGYTAQEALGRTGKELGLWVHSQENRQFFELLREHGRVDEMIAEFATRNGNVIRCKLAAAVTEMNGERVVITVGRDLTGLDRAKQERRQSERKFRAVFETSPEPMSITRMRDSCVLEVNDACAQQLGLPREQVVGRRTSELVTYADPLEREQLMQLLAANGKVSNHATRLLRADGVAMDLLESCSLVELEGEACVVWSWRDVTAMREAERALAQSEARYRSLFNSALNTLLVFAPDGKLVDTNAAGCACLGLSREQMIGMSYRELLGVDVLERILPHAREFRNRRSLLTEFTLGCADGTRRDVEIAAGSLPDGNVLAIVRDISERKRAEAALEELNASLEQRVKNRTAELEAANRELDSFSHSVSHDLRAPLFHISGFASLLRTDAASSLSRDGRHFLERIEQGAQQMGGLLESLLEFSRASRAAMRRDEVDMQAQVGEVLAMLRGPESARAEIRVGELPAVRGDAMLLRQVWQNLIGNALKFSRHASAPCIEISALRRGGEVEFQVRDNGAGFDMNQAGKLFGVFERLHAAEEFEGSGAGLSIVKRIVERHGGRISAAGERGRGATLRFSLPA